ncbi:hypothetical protein [Amycolatopsis rubida]|uniref:Uncharacterized protein n=1 Tax=Amycolatopsis rubida TaxID=112413 RepID=A0A1I5E0E5_9PSEU|nr:hypothetical protein [Amycolatopsis rubida]SFO04975.1 hypothetical protein SAMN05421854_101434 [Amycolatopsis rubida]
MATTSEPATTTPAATRDAAPRVPPRLTKHDRVALGAIRIAAALPGELDGRPWPHR